MLYNLKQHSTKDIYNTLPVTLRPSYGWLSPPLGLPILLLSWGDHE